VRLSFISVAVIVLVLLGGGTGFSAGVPAPEQTKTLREILDASPPNPKEHNVLQLAQIYLQRARAAQALGESERALKEFTIGIQVVGPKHPAS